MCIFLNYKSIFIFLFFWCFTVFAFPAIKGIRSEQLYLNNSNKVEESFDPIEISKFLKNHPKLLFIEKDLRSFYVKEKYTFQWYDERGLNEFAQVLTGKINNIEEEGILSSVPYLEELNTCFEDVTDTTTPRIEIELILTSFYIYYTNKVLKGISIQKSIELGWYLPRKNQSYFTQLDSLLQNPKFDLMADEERYSSYNKLKKALVFYKEIESKGGWECIDIPLNFRVLKPNDTSNVILKLRKNLVILGDLEWDSGSNRYDESFKRGMLQFKKRHAFEPDVKIGTLHIEAMNTPVNERIEAIIANMERYRWTLAPKVKEYIVVNIPSFQMTYYKEGKVALESKVVVGKAMNQTAIFSGILNQIVFCPYWYVPTSIIQNEIKPEIEKNPNYLVKHDMEWFEDKLRQRPGAKNSLGVVKFLFPNNNNIYLHDTPSKSLFKKEYRAFSHGCIRLEKPVELAKAILKDDKNWTSEKIDETIACGYEFPYLLKTKIPVSIGYFTSWVDDQGLIYFFKDIYNLDHRLIKILGN